MSQFSIYDWTWLDLQDSKLFDPAKWWLSMSKCNNQDPTCNKHSDHLQYGYQDRLQYDYQDQLEVVRNRERAWAWTHAAEQLRISHAGHPWLCLMPRYAKANPCQIKGSSESSEIEKSRARVLTSVLISGFIPSKRNSPIGDHPPKYAWNWTIYIIYYWNIWKAPGTRVYPWQILEKISALSSSRYRDSTFSQTSQVGLSFRPAVTVTSCDWWEGVAGTTI